MSTIVVPATATPGQTITVDGSRFTPKVKFALSTVDANGVEVGGTSNTNRPRPDGTFHVGINVPPLAGPAKVRAYQGSTLVAEAPILVAVTPTPPTPTPDGGYPADTAYTTMPTAGGTTPALPAYLTPLADATFSSKTTRITNTIGRRHNYAVLPAWNSDQSQLLMGYRSPYAFLDGTTYAVIRTTGAMLGYPSWSNTDPLKIFGTYSGDNHLYSQHATTDAQSYVHTFTGYTEVSLGDGEGHVDDSDRYVALLTKNGTTNGILVYDIIAATIVASTTFATRPDNATISRKGGYVIVNWSADGAGAEKGVWKYTRALTGGVQLETTGGNHGDCGLDAAGNEVYVYINGAITSYNLATNAATTLLPAGTAFGFGHISCRNIDRPGWAYLSTYDYTSTSGNRGRDMVIAVKTDGSQTVEQFGFQNNHTNGSQYDAQPQAVPSRDGKRVAFASVWGTGTTVYEYVIEAA